ncbi:MAG: hypothetical protein ABSB40_12825 [Nitrososphaeria archaeon]|jgi:hypothetical protein
MSSGAPDYDKTRQVLSSDIVTALNTLNTSINNLNTEFTGQINTDLVNLQTALNNDITALQTATHAYLKQLAVRLNALPNPTDTGDVFLSICDSICYASSMWLLPASGGYIVPSTKYGQFNRPSLKVVTSSTINDTGGLIFNFLPTSVGVIGFAGYFIGYTYNALINIIISHTISGNNYTYGLKVNLNGGAVAYWGSDSAWHSGGTIPIYNGAGMPFSIKITIDLAAHKYGHLYLGGDMVLDMTAYSFSYGAGSNPDSTLIECFISNIAASSQTIYIQDAVLTTNEVL